MNEYRYERLNIELASTTPGAKDIKRKALGRWIILYPGHKCLLKAQWRRYASPRGLGGENTMKPHSIVFAMVFLAGCAMSRGPAVMPGGDYQSMMSGMDAAQAEASQPGDENLSCDQLQEQMLAIAQDPAFLEHVETAGKAAEKDMAQMQVGKGEIAAKSAATVIAATVPGADMGHMMAAAMENQSRAAQGKARMEAKIAEGHQMMGFMPMLMRGQRLIELAAARKCEWAADVDLSGAQ